MTMLNNNPLDLSGADGEVITVQVVEQNTVRQVSQTLNGAPLNATSFALSRTTNPSILTIALGFSGNTGAGRYSITVRGSQGGDVSSFVVHEPPAPKVDTVSYTFDVR